MSPSFVLPTAGLVPAGGAVSLEFVAALRVVGRVSTARAFLVRDAIGGSRNERPAVAKRSCERVADGTVAHAKAGVNLVGLSFRRNGRAVNRDSVVTNVYYRHT